MPKTDATLTTEISGKFTSGSNIWTGQEVEDSFIDMVDNKLNKLDYSPTGGTAHPAVAWVTSNGNNGTALVGSIGAPFLTIDAAMDALPAGGGTIIIGVGEFAAPDDVSWKNNVTLIGTQIPKYNWTISQATGTSVTYTAPTALVGGTIIKGGININNLGNIGIFNLGIDVGSAYTGGGGTNENCIGFALSTSGTGVTPPLSIMNGFYAKDLILLGPSAGSAFHCIVIENINNAVMDNIQTCYHTHGIVTKGCNTSISNVKCYSHNDDAIIIKSNNYSIQSRCTLNNFILTSASGYEGAGLKIENASSSDNGTIAVTNGIIFKCSYGVLSTGTLPHVNISNVICKDISGDGFSIAGLIDSKISDCSAIDCGADGFDVAGTRLIISDNISVDNTGYGYRYGTSIYGQNNFANNNTAGASTGTITAI